MAELKIITRPEVYILSSPRLWEEEAERFVRVECGAPEWSWRSLADEEADQIPEVAGRLCYRSFKTPRPGGPAAYIENILEKAHGSVIEHSHFGLIFTGISRSCSHEIVRHRAGCSYSQESQRFIDCSDVAFVVPPAMLPYHADWLAKDPGRRRGWSIFEQWRNDRTEDLAEYADLTAVLEQDAPAELTGTDRRKWARQAARSVLPECTETRLLMTASCRAWRHFLEMRGSRHADAEIRRLAVEVYKVLRFEAPLIFADFSMSPLPDGTQELTCKHHKV